MVRPKKPIAEEVASTIPAYPRAADFLPRFVTADNWREFSEADIAGALASAQHDHDPIAVRNLIYYFHFRLEAGELFDGPAPLGNAEGGLVELVQMAFARFVAGDNGMANSVSLDSAFGLIRSRGERGREDHFDRNLCLAAMVELELRADRASGRQPKADLATERVGRWAGLSKAAVRLTYVEHREAMKLMTNEELNSLCEAGEEDSR